MTAIKASLWDVLEKCDACWSSFTLKNSCLLSNVVTTVVTLDCSQSKDPSMRGNCSGFCNLSNVLQVSISYRD